MYARKHQQCGLCTRESAKKKETKRKKGKSNTKKSENYEEGTINGKGVGVKEKTFFQHNVETRLLPRKTGAKGCERDDNHKW